MTAPQRPHSRGRDVAWMVLVVLMALYGVATVIGGVYALLTGQFGLVLRSAPWLLVAYWVGMGAWRRTSWLAARNGPAPAGPLP